MSTKENDWFDSHWYLQQKYADLLKLTPEGQAVEKLVAEAPVEIVIPPEPDANAGVFPSDDDQPEPPAKPSPPMPPAFTRQLAGWPPPPSEKQKEVIPVADPFKKQPVPLKPGDGQQDFGRPPLEL